MVTKERALRWFRGVLRISVVVMVLLIVLTFVYAGIIAAQTSTGEETAVAKKTPEVTLTAENRVKIASNGFYSSAIAVGLSAIAGGIAVAYVGAAAMGSIAERPEIAGRAIIFAGLAEGIAIYGLIIAIMILGHVGRILP